MNLICLMVTAILPMLNPDGVPWSNGIIDPAELLARRALNTALDKDASFSATVFVTIEGAGTEDDFPQKQEFLYMRHGGWERFELDAAKISIKLDPEELATLKHLQMEK